MEYNLTTIGNKNYTGMKCPVYISPDGSVPINAESGQRFRIVLIKEGGGIFLLQNMAIPFSAPSVFCFNEKENPVLETSPSLKYSTIFFHPAYINNAFEFPVLRGEKTYSFTFADYSDLYWFDPFLRRQDLYWGKFTIGPLTFHRLSDLFIKIDQQLKDQPLYWPCRARSFLIECLFLLTQILHEPRITEDTMLFEQPKDIHPILVFLHTRYSEKISIDMLAREFHTNRTTIQERFSRATGKPIMKYIADLRINLAMLLLKETTIPIVEVASRAGYQDISHFGRIFKKAASLSPMEYREEKKLGYSFLKLLICIILLFFYHSHFSPASL